MPASASSVREALRRLYCEEDTTLETLAAAARLRTETVARLAAREGWVRRASVSPGDPAERVALLADRLIREVEAIERDAQGGAYDKLRIESVTALTRALEKLSDFAQSGAARQEAAKRTDEEIAAALARIDDRIVELARDYAERLVREGAYAAPAAAGAR